MPDEMLDESFIRSKIKPPGRRVWTLSTDTGKPAWAAIFLDAELYIERVNAPDVLTRLQQSRSIPSLKAVFVSNYGAAVRHSDYVCDAAYGAFLSEEVVPWLSSEAGFTYDRIIIVGLSLSGLAAAHAALAYPSQFRGAICQSPSLWWDDERFRSAVPLARNMGPRFWVSVGDKEIEHGISHPPYGLFQGVSQLDACQRGSDALKAAEYRVNYRVFRGGHDPACWQDDLVLALPWIESA